MADTTNVKPLLGFYDIPAAIKALYATEHGATGGCLHVVLDDSNTEAQHVALCAHRARDCEHSCFELALALLALGSDEQRDRALAAAGYAGCNV